MTIGFYTKAIVSIIAAGIGIFAAALSDGIVSPIEIVNIVVAIVTAFTVYLIPNLPEGPARIAKTITAFAGAAAAALINILANALGFADVTLSDWLFVLLAGLAAIGVYVIPNSTPVVTKTVSVGSYSVTATAPAAVVDDVLEATPATPTTSTIAADTANFEVASFKPTEGAPVPKE